jgi:hypothetical protein
VVETPQTTTDRAREPVDNYEDGSADAPAAPASRWDAEVEAAEALVAHYRSLAAEERRSLGAPKILDDLADELAEYAATLSKHNAMRTGLQYAATQLRAKAREISR